MLLAPRPACGSPLVKPEKDVRDSERHTEHQPFSYLGVGEAFRYQAQHLHLTSSQPKRKQPEG